MTDPEACYIGTEPWKPKEALEEGGVITDKADIFAFGLTLWEMMTLAIPHVNLPEGDDEGKVAPSTLPGTSLPARPWFMAAQGFCLAHFNFEVDGQGP